MKAHHPHIDGLRALAVLPVILFHFGVPGVSGGFAGVDVFFVISGFLITGVIDESLKAGKFSLAHFYERRARRILPALFLTCFLSFIAAWLLFMPADFRSFAESLEGAAGFASNFIFARNTGYFAESLSVKPLLHTWSLAVEEQFYLLFPLLLMLLARERKKKNRTAVLYLLMLLSFLLNLAFLAARPERTFYLLHTRAWELLAGAVLQLFLRDIRVNEKTAEMMGGAGLLLLAGFYTLYTRDTPFPGTTALVPCFGAVLLIWSGLKHDTAAARLLSSKPLVTTGVVSYGLYLYHWPVLVFARYWSGRAPFVLEAAPLYLLTAALALLSYILVERPVRAGTLLRKRRTVFAFSAAGLVVMGLAGFAGVKSNGVPQRFNAAVLRYADGAKDTNWRWAGCIPKDPAALDEKNICAVGARKKQKPDFLAWGDSHLDALEPALAAQADRHGKFGWAVAYSGCPSLVGADRADRYVSFSCPAIAQRVLEIIKRNKIKTVLLITRWDMYAEGWEKGAIETARQPFITYNGLRGRAAFEASFGATVAGLKRAGVTDIWVVRQVPPQLAHVPSVLALAEYLGRDRLLLRRPYAEVAARLAFEDGVFGGVKGLRFIEPAQKFCPGGAACLIEAGGKSLYSDNNHMSVTGALWAEDVLEPFFNSLPP